MVHNVHLSLVVFSVIDNTLVAYLPNNRLPSRPLVHGETLAVAVKKLTDQTSFGKIDTYVEQLYTTEDPFEQGSVLVVYMLLCPIHVLSERTVFDMKPVIKIDASVKERAILSYATQRLRWKIEYTNIVYSLLPREFTLTELQGVYEAILGKKLDKRNFRKKILGLGILKDTRKKRGLGRARPAEVYCFKKRSPTIVEVL